MSILQRLAKLVRKTFQPIFAIGLLCLLGGIAIWFWGSRLSLGGITPFQNQDIRMFSAYMLIGIGILLLVIGLIRGIIALIRSRRAASQKPKREPTAEEYECAALDKTFSAALNVLSQRWSGRGSGIYGLPWYLMIGHSESGKSSLIEHSDLRFPIDHEITAEIGALPASAGRDMLRWRIAGNEAVILDLEGGYFDSERGEDPLRNALWRRLLTNLRKARTRRPINGVVVTIDFVAFSAMNNLEREAYSASLRRDINMMVENLGTRMTVHLVFTKLDLLGGFPDYFEGISNSEREALFGFHFTYEGKYVTGWKEQFAEQYRAFTDKLSLHLKRRIYSLKNATSRQEAFSLYRTFLGMEEPLKAFLHDALSPDKFTTPPLVRGLYFASSRQENVPRNIFLENVGGRYALEAPLYGTSQSASYPYFSLNILKKAVFPEAGLAGSNLRQAARYRRQAWMTTGVCALLLMGGGAYWMNRYDHNLAQAETVARLATDFSTREETLQRDYTGASQLETLDTMRAATFTFEDYREVGAAAAQVSLYQGDRIGPIVDTAYRGMLNNEFGPVLTAGVAEELIKVCPRDGDRALELLRVYRMMGDLDGRERDVVDGYFRALWQRNFEADAETQTQLYAHLNHMLTNEPVAYEIDDGIVSAAQSDLSGIGHFQRVYFSLRAEAERQLPDGIEFRNSVGTDFELVYEADPQFEAARTSLAAERQEALDADDCANVQDTLVEYGPFEIPLLFTRTQYVDFFVEQYGQVAEVAADDLWVLGALDDTVYSEEDYEQIRSNIRNLYVEDYIRTWRSALNNMRVRDYDDIREAVTSLRALSGPNNPIRRVAQLVRDNTIIYPQETLDIEQDSATLTELGSDPDRIAALRINAAFAEIHSMLDEAPDGGVTNIDEIQETLAALDSYMRSIADAPRPEQRALELAIERAKLQGEDPIFHLQRIAERAPAPFNEHLEHIADQSWRVVMSAATEEINRRWHEEIYGEYLRLIEGKYPFDRASNTDLPLEDFITFFEPGGILDTFYNDELLTFVDEITGQPRIIDGQSLEVDLSFARQLRSAIEITRALFDANGEVYVEFSITPVQLSSNLRRAVLNFEGQLVSSSHSAAQPITIVWPNILDGPVSSRIDMAPLTSSGRSLNIQWDGPWSWLRLYDAAGRSNVTNNSVDISFANANGQSATFRVRSESRINLFFNSPLSGFQLPAYVRSPDV